MAVRAVCRARLSKFPVSKPEDDIKNTVEFAMSTSSAGETLAPLPRGMACWRLAKLPQAELKQRLDAFQLQTDGTKRTLAARLHAHLASLPTPDPSSSLADEADKRDGHGVGEEAGTRSHRRHRTRAQAPRGPGSESSRRRRHQARHHRRTRRPRTRSRSASRSSRSSSRSRSSSSGASSPDRSTSSRSPNPSASSRSSSTGTCSSVSPAPRRSRSRRGRSSHPRHRSSGPRPGHRRPKSRRHRHHHHGHGERHGGHHHRHGRRSRRESSGHGDRHRPRALPPIPDRIMIRIRRGEYIDLNSLLQANLANASERHMSHRDRGPRHATREVNITSLAEWIEAWSAYAAVISSLWPHLAARLFQYQQFITLKSKCFQTKAWRRYDSEFRLKLAANKSWHFGEVDTELWASCFAADGLAATTSPNPACFGCGSTSHLYASCPLRCQPARPAANHDLPRPQPPTKGQPAPEERREPCFVYNEKGHCFRGPRCPYAHMCLTCGGQHPKRSCPTPRP